MHVGWAEFAENAGKIERTRESSRACRNPVTVLPAEKLVGRRKASKKVPSRG